MKPELVFLLENAGWPALLLDGTGVISHANSAAVKLFGTALEGASPHLSAIWASENHHAPDQFLSVWERSPSANVALKLRGSGGNTLSSLASLCSFAQGGQKFFLLQLLVENVTPPAEAKALGGENTLAHKQKLDCALQLARTVALDFNNALTSILGHTSLVLSKMDPGHPWRASLLEVEKSASKAAEIANDLGTFSRQEKETRNQTAGNLNLLLQRTIEFFQQNAGTVQIDWKLIPERKLFAARYDEAKMQQAFVKIIDNAVQAMIAHSQGHLTIQTRNIELADRTQDRNVQLAPGAYVCVEITDNGSGIPPEILPRIFEPFFTTKGRAHRGLGLAWVYGIVTNHGGGVAVSSQPGAGTAVRVYLPAEKRVVHDDTLQTADLSGTQSVLLVDDEDLLLTMGQTILSSYGYRVITANTGEKALDILRARKPSEPVDLMITDLVMPAMSGRELVERVRDLYPGTRILCTSGYVGSASPTDDAGYLQKPFTSQGLLLKVKQVLNT
jgi:two-component system, cell cycle sensor histidine kinase and response regulator CckA